MPAKYKNNASATIAASISDSDTTIVLTTGFGAFFPTLTAGFYFYATLYSPSGEYEIVKVTARSSDTLTVVRGQDGTVAKAFTAGDGIAQRLVAANLNNFVEIDSAQTITGQKTFSNSIIVDNVGIQVGTSNTPGGGGNVRYKRDSGVVQWAAGILGSTGSENFEWYNITANATRMTLDLSGNLTAAGDITAFSDERLKSDIQTLSNALATVKQLRGTAYVKDGRASIGVIAQEVQRVVPQVVHENTDGYLSVAYGNLVGLLIEAVKELNAKVEKLERNS